MLRNRCLATLGLPLVDCDGQGAVLVLERRLEFVHLVVFIRVRRPVLFPVPFGALYLFGHFECLLVGLIHYIFTLIILIVLIITICTTNCSG